MKSTNLFLIGLLFSMGAFSTKAQGIGIRAGYNFATVTGENEHLNDIGNNNGFYVGIYKEFDFIVRDLLYFVPELQYSRQGFSTGTTNIDLDYINIPLLAKIYIAKVVSLETGPQFGFNISGSGSSNFSYNTVDPAWAAGLSINLPFRLSISGRYIGSFSEVVEGGNARNQVFQAGLAYRFKK